MSKSRRILVLLAMASVLCADRAVVAAPASPSRTVEFAQMAQRLVNRLGASFRNSIPSALQEPERQGQPVARPTARIYFAPVLTLSHSLVSPFQFRLPPPIV